MATADQIKSLVKAYIDHSDEKFKTVVLQIAAHEAKLGHDNLARDLKRQVDKIGAKRVLLHFCFRLFFSERFSKFSSFWIILLSCFCISPLLSLIS